MPNEAPVNRPLPPDAYVITEQQIVRMLDVLAEVPGRWSFELIATLRQIHAEARLVIVPNAPAAPPADEPAPNAPA